MAEEDTSPPILRPIPKEPAKVPPWIWIPMVSLCLLCILYISFRRAPAVVPPRISNLFNSFKTGGIWLPEDDVERQILDDLSEDSESEGEAGDETLPRASSKTNPSSLKSSHFAIPLKAKRLLGINQASKKRISLNNVDSGWLQVFWGKPKRSKKFGKSSNFWDADEDEDDDDNIKILNSSTPFVRISSQPSTSSNSSVSNLIPSNEPEEEDAVELPQTFELPESSTKPVTKQPSSPTQFRSKLASVPRRFTEELFEEDEEEPGKWNRVAEGVLPFSHRKSGSLEEEVQTKVSSEM